MPQNIRAFVPGGTFFFTVTLLERCGKLMMLKAGCATLSRPTGFRRPARYGEILKIETRLQEVRPRALVFRFEFYPETGRDLVAEGTANLVAIDAAWRARELPEKLKGALSQLK